jgi:hypothetical protein
MDDVWPRLNHCRAEGGLAERIEASTDAMGERESGHEFTEGQGRDRLHAARGIREECHLSFVAEAQGVVQDEVLLR